MTDHLIRLRGGWDAIDAEGRTLPGRLTLPLAALPDGPGRLRLSRSFQAPPIDPSRETLWLRLVAVPGLLAVVLNGREVARGPFQESALWLPLVGSLPPRNQLVLEVGTPAPSDRPTPGTHWGEVALVVRGVAEGEGRG